MKFEVVRKNSTIKVDGKTVKGTFESEKMEQIEALLKAKYIKEVRDGKTTNK